jgi:pSer/pThr/pTyr-binding forkhead associated (FHA) protein
MQTAPVGLESPRQTILRGNAVPRPPRRSSVPPAPPPVTGAGGALPPSAPTLHLVFNGEKIPIDKTEFVIGRGSKTSDLAIKDGNISRRHCAVVFENGSYVIRDLGSTNGVEHAGRRIDQKEIDEGDIFQLCDYELRFTFQ